MDPARLLIIATVRPRPDERAGRSARVSKSGASTFTFIVARKSSGSISARPPMWPRTAALLITRSIARPESLLPSDSIEVEFATSSSSISTATSNACTASMDDEFRQQAMILQPIAAYWRTNSSPIPRFAPVIRIVELASRIMNLNSFLQ